MFYVDTLGFGVEEIAESNGSEFRISIGDQVIIPTLKLK